MGADATALIAQTFPALFGLFANGFLPPNLRIIGYARTKMDKEVRSTLPRASSSARNSTNA